jgi:hypothetical protein
VDNRQHYKHEICSKLAGIFQLLQTALARQYPHPTPIQTDGLNNPIHYNNHPPVTPSKPRPNTIPFSGKSMTPFGSRLKQPCFRPGDK